MAGVLEEGAGLLKQFPQWMQFIILLGILYTGYAANQLNANLNTLTKTTIIISERSVQNSEKIAENQRLMMTFQERMYERFHQSQKDLLKLQERVFERVWEQDKVISQVRRDTVQMDRENIIRREQLERNKPRQREPP